MHSSWGIVESPRRRWASSLFAGALILLFAWFGCQSRPPTVPDDGDDCLPGQPCGGGVDDPDDPDDAGGDGGGDEVTFDSCAGALPVTGEVEYPFDNAAATLDGLPHAVCSNQGLDQIDRDVWLCWTSECNSLVLVDSCDRTGLDTRLAVYDGCECPATTARLLDCADDDCSVQARAVFEAVAGRQYLIRIGVFPGTEGGAGSVAITCGFDACPTAGDCHAGHGQGGCDDADCCNAVCRVDPVCCTATWDDQCVQEAAALCNGGFDSCAPGTGSCRSEKATPGCDDSGCCNDVCLVDTYCCLEEWDEECVAIEARTCFGSCTASAGACDAAHGGPGCADIACCAEVCPRDPSCCSTAWTAACADLAAQHCTAD